MDEGGGPAEATSDAPPGLRRDDRAARRALVAALAVAALAAAAAWTRFALPFSSAEARVVHQALLRLGMTPGPDFGGEATAAEARVAATAMLHVGVTERPLRLLGLLGAAVAAVVVLEAARTRRATTAVVVAALSVAAPRFADADAVRAEMFAAPLAALVLLSLRPADEGRGVVATLLAAGGAAALAALQGPVGLAAPCAVLVAALFEGRLGPILRAGLVAGAGAAALRAVAGGAAFERLLVHDGPWGPPAPLFGEALPGGAQRAAIVAGVLLALVAFGLVHRAEGRRGRAALAVGWILTALLARRTFASEADGARLAADLLPIVALLVARTCDAGSVALRGASLAGAVAAAAAFAVPPGPRDDPRDLLASFRRVATTTDAAVFGGPDRVGAAVYARLGHDPDMPFLCVPEDAALGRLAERVRALRARIVWSDVPLDGAAGIVAAPPDATESAPPAPLRRYVLTDR